MTRSNYDKHPRIAVSTSTEGVIVGWRSIARRLSATSRVVVECYPGAPVDVILDAWHGPVLDTRTLFRGSADIDADLAVTLTEDPVFGRLDPVGIGLFFNADAVGEARTRLAREPATVIGPGAAYVAQNWTSLAHVSLARWELQRRQRRGEIGSLGTDDAGGPPAVLYKRAFFVDWRVGDRIKTALLPRIDWVIDANAAEPRMIAGQTWRGALRHITTRPFRVVPFFDPGPWGGQWMRHVLDLPEGPPNYAWCFDCVPEENSILLGFGAETVELPATDLVFAEPRALLGEQVFATFGAEFPIRFDLLDTMGGGNLSLQVHPKADYAAEHFGLSYTQDESYYVLDAEPGGVVYLGLRDDADADRFEAALEKSRSGVAPFPASDFVNVIAARPHDHFLIPAGTIHCSGRGTMVLEISATPYIFTFKLWDWGRLGLNGKPRPLHHAHGLANISWNRRAAFTADELVNTVTPLACTPDYTTERTGLHKLEFIETERSWFSGAVPFDTGGGVNVLNLVSGPAAIVESPAGAFEPFEIHYAETFIVPAAVGTYTVRPQPGVTGPLGILRAFVRPNC